MKTCDACARYLRLDEPTCPFCGVATRIVAAPSSPWLLGLGLGLVAATASACGSDDVEPTSVATEDSGSAGSDTELPPLPGMSSTNPGNDTINNDDDWGEGVTYGGPDETDSIGSTTGWTGDESSTTRADEAEGSTTVGPDETDTTESSGSESGSSGTGTSTGPG